jgi:pyruvate/2-oxoglutarate dehydrogenase complex dihydrolipoamide dehydrogenase (E3) component
VVDSAPELGGLCILRGCMPSKTLIYSAEVLHLASQASRFGLNIPTASVDMAALHQRKRSVIGEFADYRQKQLKEGPFTLYRNRAQFLDESHLALDDGIRLEGDHFLIATGSVVNEPPVPGLAATPKWTSDDVLDLDFLPESVVVLGGGIVACELAQFLARVGTRTTLVQRSPHILKETSPEASAVLTNTLRQEGLEVITDTQLISVAETSGSVEVRFRHAGGERTVEAAHLFNALGRRPNTDTLHLEQAGVKLKPSGHIAVNANQQTDNPRIYAAGDCTGPHEIVHVAILQGELAARHACGLPADPVNYDHLTQVVFTDPQIASCGLSESQLQARGVDYLAADYPFDDHGKSILMEAKAGYVKVMAERKTGRLLGAECVGKDASELIHAMSVAVACEATVQQLLKAHWYHPTLSEIWTYPLEDCL